MTVGLAVEDVISAKLVYDEHLKQNAAQRDEYIFCLFSLDTTTRNVHRFVLGGTLTSSFSTSDHARDIASGYPGNVGLLESRNYATCFVCLTGDFLFL